MILTQEQIEKGEYKLSDLIDTVVADAKLVDRGIYIPDSRHYYFHNQVTGKCYICDAGLILAGTLDLRDENALAITDGYSSRNNIGRAVEALDYARMGELHNAIALILKDDPERRKKVPWAKVNIIPMPVNISYKTWEEMDMHIKSMATIADRLRSLGV